MRNPPPRSLLPADQQEAHGSSRRLRDRLQEIPPPSPVLPSPSRHRQLLPVPPPWPRRIRLRLPRRSQERIGPRHLPRRRQGHGFGVLAGRARVSDVGFNAKIDDLGLARFKVEDNLIVEGELKKEDSRSVMEDTESVIRVFEEVINVSPHLEKCYNFLKCVEKFAI
ncbi:hypothetical protein CASFOL_037353 [Castilleja foliolosa]|uniref:Uncharacterized protein n=1 Tax=Castilleja foliolosa TaxID=1961234 RepID=A0ABD3BN22_9LAMI